MLILHLYFIFFTSYFLSFKQSGSQTYLSLSQTHTFASMKNKISLFVLLFCISVYVQAQSIVGVGREVDPYHYTSVKSLTYSKTCVEISLPYVIEYSYDI